MMSFFRLSIVLGPSPNKNEESQKKNHSRKNNYKKTPLALQIDFLQAYNIKYLLTGRNDCVDKTGLLKHFELIIAEEVNGYRLYRRKAATN